MPNARNFRYFKTSAEIIRLSVMMYVRYPLSLRKVEDLLHERGIDITHETVRFWWNRFGTIFAAEIHRSRVQAMRSFRHLWPVEPRGERPEPPAPEPVPADYLSTVRSARRLGVTNPAACLCLTTNLMIFSAACRVVMPARFASAARSLRTSEPMSTLTRGRRELVGNRGTS
jgi:putative transposase